MTVKIKIAIVALAVAAVTCPHLARAQTGGMALDQENDNLGYYFYNLSSAWQSFTAGVNGRLAAIQAHVYTTNSAAIWSATLEVRVGEGTAGALLASQTVTGDSVNQRRTFVLETPLRQTAGTRYTFVFRNASTGLTVRASANLYDDGRSHHANYDYNFKTWVVASEWSEVAWRDTSFTALSTEIGTAAQLAQFAWLINNGETFAGQTLTLTADIDLGAHDWAASGDYNTRFQGTFDGAGRAVRNVFISKPAADYQGLFGSAGTDSMIQNLTVTNLDIAAAEYVGGVVGRAFGGVTNCRAHGAVSGTYMVGGVVGCAEGALLDCANAADVAGLNGVGGVAGLARGGAATCRNSGAISGNNDIGGVVGHAAASVTDCVNSGVVSASDGERTGGGAGSCDAALVGCHNSGDVSGPATVGGVVGDPAFFKLRITPTVE